MISPLSSLFLAAVFLPTVIRAFPGRGDTRDLDLDRCIHASLEMLANLLVLGIAMWGTARIARGVLVIIVGFAVQGVFLYRALRDRDLFPKNKK